MGTDFLLLFGMVSTGMGRRLTNDVKARSLAFLINAASHQSCIPQSHSEAHES